MTSEPLKASSVLHVESTQNEHGGTDCSDAAQHQRTVLIPQPSQSPDDPLNWPSVKKNIILGVIVACSFLPDYGSVTGAATLAAQAEEYGLAPEVVNHSQAGNQFMVGAGGVVAVILSAYFGRLPVLFWFMLAAFVTSAAQAGTKGFIGFFVPRIMNGFFSGVAQGGGLMFIKDIFFFHEQARTINVWQSCVLLSPFLGPLLASFMTIHLSWRWPFWIFSIMTGISLLGVVLFGEETFYDRRIPPDVQPARRSRWLRLVGIEQWHSRRLRNTFPEAILRSLQVLRQPIVLLVNFYYVCIFAWLVAINATLPIFLTSVYGFGPKHIGFMYFAPIIAAVLAYATGHWLHDMLPRFHVRRNNGHFSPESRLLITWLALPFMLAGLVLVGFSLQRHYHYMLVALGWGFYTLGLIINSVSINIYLLNSYPEASGEVGMWVNFSRTAGGFIISYFQVDWVTRVGAEAAFGTQAAICAVVFPIVIVLQVFGRSLREWGGNLNFKTD